MKRIAFFVEGLTEQLFIEKLILELLGQHNVSIEKRQMRGGKNGPIRITHIGSPQIAADSHLYILITDCGGETTVKSYIMEQRENLIRKGYSHIFGIRDVRPNIARSEIEKLKQRIYYRIPQKDCETKFILAIMEIEAWFLAEEKHFEKLHSQLTCDLIQSQLNFDPLGNTELVEEPAQLLNQIYQLVGLSYGKTRTQLERTVENMDYANLYLEVPNRNASLKTLIDAINNSFFHT